MVWNGREALAVDYLSPMPHRRNGAAKATPRHSPAQRRGYDLHKSG
ncbi:hypothetical protein ABZ547_33650 [Streptomyces sparsogenes]